MQASALDIAIGLAYFLAIPALGIWAGRREGDLAEYFLGGRRIPWWAVWLSIIAAETSAVTFISVPARAYTSDWTYLATAFGNILGRVIVATVFLKPFFDLKVFTVYGYLERRFGRKTRNTAAVVFLITRLLASGVRLMGGALIVQAILDIDLTICIAVLGAMTCVYTIAGGVKAVIATDVVQVIVMFGGAFAAAIAILWALPHGIADVTAVLPPEKTKILDWTWDPTKETTVWGGLLVTLLIMSTHGTDQDFVQRMLTAKDVASSRRALLASGLLDIPIVLIFLAIGSLLFAYYKHFPDPTLPARPDRIFTHFITTRLPPGVRGLVVSGILSVAMGSLSAAMNALASTAMVDLAKPYVLGESTPERDVRWSRGLTLAAGALLVGVAIAFSKLSEGTLLTLAYESIGYTYGSLLGVFLLGFLAHGRGHDAWNLAAMAAGIVAVVYVKVWRGWAWSTFIPTGTLVTFVVGVVATPPSLPELEAEGKRPLP